MRTFLTALLLLTVYCANAQINFNGFTSDFRTYNGLPPTCYTPSVNNLNGHLMGINNELCRLYQSLSQLNTDSLLINKLQAQIDSILSSIQNIDIISSDNSFFVVEFESNYDISRIINVDDYCTGTNNLDQILQYLIDYYCPEPPPNPCCDSVIYANDYQIYPSIAVIGLSTSLIGECSFDVSYEVLFNGSSILSTTRTDTTYVLFGAWEESDTFFVNTSVFVYNELNELCDTLFNSDTIIVNELSNPTIAVNDFVVIQRQECDTVAVTNNDIKPCGVDSISIVSTTPQIASATIYNDSLIIICRTRFAFETDTVNYALISNCGNPISDTASVIITANLQPQVPLAVCYTAIDSATKKAQLDFSVTTPSGYTLLPNSIAWKVSDNTNTFTEYATSNTSPVVVDYGSDVGIDLDSARITVYMAFVNIISNQPLFYQVDLVLADGECDTLTIDTTASPDFFFARNLQLCFNYIGYQSGGTTLSVNSGTLFRYGTSNLGFDTTIGLDSIQFLVDEVDLPCSNDSTYLYEIKNIPPYTITNIDGNPVSITSGLSVSISTSSINVNAGVAIGVVSSIGACDINEFTQTWSFTWKGRPNTFVFAFDGVNYLGQCINLNGVILP